MNYITMCEINGRSRTGDKAQRCKKDAQSKSTLPVENCSGKHLIVPKTFEPYSPMLTRLHIVVLSNYLTIREVRHIQKLCHSPVCREIGS